MHKRFGRLEFGDLLAAASSYASDGFPASEGLCRSIALAFEDLAPEVRRIFAPAGRPPVAGEWIRQVVLGKIIEEIALGGSEAFYRGWPSELMRDALQDMGVPSDASDFRDFEPEWVDPLVFDYRGTAVHEAPPNSMSATSLLMLKLLSEHDLSRTGPLSPERLSLTMKAAETAYERKDRMLGDPRFCKIDMDAFMATHSEDRRYAGRIKGGDTTAFSVVDREGNLVSGIQSLFHQFGSRVFVPGCGIMLNNRGSGFGFKGPNKVEPRKRPLHTLSSLILERGGTDRVAIGTSGGEYRPMQHTLLVTNVVDYHMALEEAVQHPRFLWSGGSDLIVEAGWQAPAPPRYGVQRVPMSGMTGVCQAVEAHRGTRKAVCDARGDGLPAGF
jgi:gamma-glutamyltranspeptidase/glutathione hydrolase